MITENSQDLVIEDSTFEEARQNFNRVLQRLFKNMLDGNSTEGSITLKIEVDLERNHIPNYDPDIEGETREIQIPKFKHKVSSSITVKDELTGNKNPEMQLVWDDERKMYVLAYISETDQRTIFDKDAPWNQQEQDGEVIEADQNRIETNTPLLPGVVADETALPGEVVEEEILSGEAVGQEEDPEEDLEEDNGYDYEEPDREDQEGEE